MDIFDPNAAKYIPFKENIIIANEESMLAIQKTTGVVKWQKHYDFETQNSLTIIGSQLFIMEGFSRAIRVYDADTGNEIGALRISLPAFAAIEHNEMTTINNMLIFANGKIVYAYSK